MTCQSLDFITQYLIIHDVTESYTGNRLKFKVDQCIFMLETGEFIDITSHITVWHWYVSIVRSGGDGAQFSKGSWEPFWCTLLCMLASLPGAVASASLPAAAAALLLQFPLLAKIRNFRLFIAKTLSLGLL